MKLEEMHAQNAPRVTVVIPCVNDGEFIADAVDSVQEPDPVEIVVVDDGSTDPATLEAIGRLEREGVRVIRHERSRGVSAARMTGVRATAAPYVFPLDANDLVAPGVLTMMAIRLEGHPEADVCFGDYLEFGEHLLVRAVPEQLDLYRLAYTNDYPASALFRRTVLEATGGWQFPDAHGDWDLWMRLAKQGSKAVHLVVGLPTYGQRLYGKGNGELRRADPRRIHARLRSDHPDVLERIPENRSRSDLSSFRKLLYPIVYGKRSWRLIERFPRTMLGRAGFQVRTRRTEPAEFRQLLGGIGSTDPVRADVANHESSPRVAVIVPCFNDGAFIADAVRSIQEHEPVELVVVDDGSEDALTAHALDRMRREGVRVIRHDRNLGLPAARMTGMRATSAPYIFPLDADDLAVPGALMMMADRLDAHPKADVCFGDYLEFGKHVMVRAVPEELDPFRIVYTNEYPASALFRRTALEEAGGWQLRGSLEDWDLWMTLAERGSRAIHLGSGIIAYRHKLHPGRLRDLLRPEHRAVYDQLRSRHPHLFDRVAAHRRASPMTTTRKLLYPLIYGGRPRWSGEPRIKAMLDRAGIWTLRR